MKKMFLLLGLLFAMVLITNAIPEKDFDVGFEYSIVSYDLDIEGPAVIDFNQFDTDVFVSVEKLKEVALWPCLKADKSSINNLIAKNTSKSDYDIKEAITPIIQTYDDKRGSFSEINKISTFIRKYLESDVSFY